MIPPLDELSMEAIKSFNRPEKPKGILVLEVINPLSIMVAARTGWIIEGQLEFYTPFHPTNPDYLKVQITYLSWVSLHLNMPLRCMIRAVNPVVKEGANRIINEVFAMFGGSGGSQEGLINNITGNVLKMNERVPFEKKVEGVPSVDVVFTPFKKEDITLDQIQMASVMNQIIESLTTETPKEDKPGTRWDGR